MDDAGKELTAADIHAIFEREYGIGSATASVVQPQMSEVAGGAVRLSAEVVLGGWMGHVQGEGNGPIDAFVNALSARLGQEVRVLDYHEHAIGSGADARAVAYLELRVGNVTRHGVGIDGSILRASMQAILSGLSRAPVAVPQTKEENVR
jgi:2-isopropylmalate synthase